MKHIAPSVLLLVAAILSAGAADDSIVSPPAAQIPLHGPEDNAALWYWRCFNEIGIRKDEANRYIELLEADTAPGNGEEFQKLRDQWSQAIATAHIAAEKPVCVFGIDRDQGLHAGIPHVAPARSLARMLAGEAVLALKTADHQKAVQLMHTFCVMMAQLQSDRMFITTLVTINALSDVMARIDATLEHGELAAETRTALADALTRTESIHPRMLGDVLEWERSVSSVWIMERWHGPEDHEEAAAFFKKFDAGPIEFLEPENLRDAVERFDEVMVRIIAAAKAQDAVLLESLCFDAREGHHGIIAALMVIPYNRRLVELNDLYAARTALIDRLRVEPPLP